MLCSVSKDDDAFAGKVMKRWWEVVSCDSGVNVANILDLTHGRRTDRSGRAGTRYQLLRLSVTSNSGDRPKDFLQPKNSGSNGQLNGFRSEGTQFSVCTCHWLSELSRCGQSELR